MTRGQAVRSAVPLAALLAVFALQNWADVHWRTHLWTSVSVNAGSAPPWYFIGNDLVEGVAAAGAMAILLCVAFVSTRVPDYSRFSRMVAWQAVLWNASKVLWGLVILTHTTSIWDEGRASTTWKTFDVYLNNPARQWTLWCGFALALPFVWADWRHNRSMAPEPSGMAGR